MMYHRIVSASLPSEDAMIKGDHKIVGLSVTILW